jgi:aldehyde dehydrogenase (NAD+)
MTLATGYTTRSFDKVYIGGSWRKPATDDVIEVISPITEELIATIPAASPADVDAAVAAARRAFDDGPWPRMTPAERAGYLRRVRDEVRARCPEMEVTFTEEIGAPAAVSQAFHTGFSVSMWDDATTLHERVGFEERRTWDGGEALIVQEPVGVVATIIPWNGPVSAMALKLPPALIAGCTVVVKPAPEGPVNTLLMAEALEAAGLPEGVISVLPGGREVGEHLVTHPGIDKVAFTGSTAAGRRIMSLCGDRITRLTLELGGKSAGIVCDDIPLDQVLPTMLPNGFGHSGQVCAATTRLLVSKARHGEFVDAVADVLRSLPIGDPREEGTAIGPLAAERQRTRVEEYIASGREQGARVVTGGGRPDHMTRGWYVEPTLFADATNEMRIAREEIFGPVLTVIPYADVDEAIAIANDSDYGLSGSVYTLDRELGEKVARRVRTGQMFVNDATMCVTQPIGGFKQSGLGREGGVDGVHAYFETKMIQGV